MGIYIFTWQKLRQALIEDEADPESSNDFGKNIIPKFLAAGEKMIAYRFDGYWKDVGTLESLWDANMDMLSRGDLDLLEDSWPIYARNYSAPATRLGSGAKVSNSFVAEGCTIRGSVEHSVLYTGCEIEEGAKIGERPENYTDQEWGIAVVGHQKTIESGSVVKPKEIV